MRGIKAALLIIALLLIIATMVVSMIVLRKPDRTGYIPDEGVVPNAETAIKIAEIIWFPIYGDSIYNKQPFEARYEEQGDCWFVSGTLPPDTVGGVPLIRIRKSDGAIMYIMHGK